MLGIRALLEPHLVASFIFVFEANPCPRIFALQTSEMLSSILDPSSSNELRGQFLVHLDHNDVPISDPF